ncbi:MULTISPECIES: hypothetical protein [Olleya]|uniref:Lipoprotein n=1 Tax=Olleya namhaensis TaxID=1144750 RepID=A0A1I3JU99_9FLAO|nr:MULTISPECIES: hypothetical protein [Olleya]PKG52102.1 hypothetical protein CXF54_05975 [Olleya sp. 1-3]SFI63783.1 hypothetical protein SAMN05443431_101554 [Olleya namhaensis]
MKKLLTALTMLIVLSCSLDDQEQNMHLETLPIDSASMPEYFQEGQTYQIDLNYTKPTTCHSFYDLYYVKDGNTRTVAVINSVLDNTSCETVDLEMEKSFNFVVNNSETYVFKFWQGEDDEGNDIYLTMEIPVQ